MMTTTRMDLANVDQVDYTDQPEFEKKLKTSLDYILYERRKTN